jgi:hypothetical protein
MGGMAADFPPPAGHVPAGSLPSEARELRLFRFGLRQFFLFVSAAVGLVGAMASVGGSWAPAVGFFAALVGAHVLATVVGTRLRDASPVMQRWNAGRPGAVADPPPAIGTPSAAALAAVKAGSLSVHQESPWRTWAAALIGLIGGGFLGAAVIPLIAGAQTNAAGLGLGAVSCGVICAWLALLGANFWMIARGAWREAREASGPEPKRKSKRVWRPIAGPVARHVAAPKDA